MVWAIPASRMKAGIEHRVPLSGRAVAIIDRMAEVHSVKISGSRMIPVSEGERLLAEGCE